MTLSKRILVVCALLIAVGLTVCLWPDPEFKPSIRLPQGVSLAEVLRTGTNVPPKGWHTNIYSQKDRSLGSRLAPGGLPQAARYWLHEARGQTLSRAPNPPAEDFVTPRLGECFQISGERYLLAKEFMWEVSAPVKEGSDWTYLCFVWGGTNQLRHERDVVALQEEGILKSGIFGMRMKWSQPQQRGVRTTEYLPTNQCAVIRDVKGLVKIVPLEYLKAYVDSGLVTLPGP